MKHTQSGNEGSITGTPDKTSLIQEKGTQNDVSKKSAFSSFFSFLLSYWWILILGFIGISALISQVSTDPIAINPTDTDITFEIDKIAYTIPANAPLNIPLSHGDHQVSLGGKNIGTFTFGWFDADSIINPTLGEYVVVEILYGDIKYEDKLTNKTITLSGSTYTGPYSIIPSSLYIKKSWDYGAYEESPATVNTKADYEIKKELFTIDMFTQSYPSDGEIEGATGALDDVLPDATVN